ncbi:2'-hydroxyisoflavone reductase [Amycolatopsis sulphurea]|uniref:2'-hydroxyisoflavone reductase n=1 Tax=Amycolatopsis sulphurea TaxID=76022 RepID=A0A2A9G2F6_9PSEU|nr:NAD-dependent epimerase/dehydratase family protein [Amycolatopsis sulphurea]PFG57042.1 2'-hydroxyisoflavone reductase [Amycolatopsis sulphurea]
MTVRGGSALVLGGTKFLGRHLVEHLLGNGWNVTVFHRGETNPNLFPEARHVLGSRVGDLTSLTCGEWDVAFDLSGYHPDEVDAAAKVLGDRVGHYVFVSTISAYASLAQDGTDETAQLKSVDGPVPAESTRETYGLLKGLCEQRVAMHFRSHTTIRPCIIAGRYDPSDRFTYWVERLAEPGTHVVPDPADVPLQYIDAADLAAWMVEVARARPVGAFNAAGPSLTFADFVASITCHAGTSSEFVRLNEAQIRDAELRPMVDLPLWLPPSDLQMKGFFTVDASKARASGLHVRDIADTIRDVRKWVRDRGDHEFAAGVSRETEQELIRRFSRR